MILDWLRKLRNPYSLLSMGMADPTEQQRMLMEQTADFGQEGIDMTNEALLSNPNIGFNWGRGLSSLSGLTPTRSEPIESVELKQAQEFTTPYTPMQEICGMFDIECQKRQAQNRGIFNAHRSV